MSTDKQALMHYIVYGHKSAGRHLIVGLDKALVTDTYIGLRTFTLVYGHLH